ncbi:O-antigen polysaccharide polymerase Wzy [Proteus mirabilis]
MELNKIKKTTLVLIILNFFSFLSSFFLFINTNNYNILSYSYIINIILTIIIFINEKKRLTSLLFLFNISQYLFIGGRIITFPFLEHELNSPFDLEFMTNFYSSTNNSIYVYSIIFLFNFLINLFYFFIKINNNKKNTIWLNILVCPIFFFYILLFLLLSISEFNLYLKTKDLGYLARYSYQSEQYSSGNSTLLILFYTFLGLLFCFRNKKIIIFSYLLLLIYSFIIILGGQRGPFISAIMMGIWLYGINKNISLKKLMSLFFLLFLFLIIMGISSRGVNGDINNYVYLLEMFIYKQGVTLGVISYSISDFQNFPIMAYVNSLIPGATRIYSLFIDNQLSLPDLGFGPFVSHTANNVMFQEGYGLGWSILLNLYLFSFNNPLIFIFFCFLFSYFLNKLDNCFYHDYWFGLSGTLATKIVFSPRDDLKNIIHFAIFFTIAYFLLKIINTTLLRYRN